MYIHVKVIINTSCHKLTSEHYEIRLLSPRRTCGLGVFDTLLFNTTKFDGLNTVTRNFLFFSVTVHPKEKNEKIVGNEFWYGEKLNKKEKPDIERTCRRKGDYKNMTEEKKRQLFSSYKEIVQ